MDQYKERVAELRAEWLKPGHKPLAMERAADAIEHLVGIVEAAQGQEPVAYFQVEYHGGMPLHQQVGSQHKGEPGVFPLYAFPPDAAARIAELEKQRDTLLKLVECISQQTPEKPDYWSSCSQCEHNISDAEDAIASVKEQA